MEARNCCNRSINGTITYGLHPHVCRLPTYLDIKAAENALSSTEAEYISLSASMREVLPLLSLMQEANTFGVPVDIGKVDIHCKIFEDNSGALELAKVLKMRPCTKHLNIKYIIFDNMFNQAYCHRMQYLQRSRLQISLPNPLAICFAKALQSNLGVVNNNHDNKTRECGNIYVRVSLQTLPVRYTDLDA